MGFIDECKEISIDMLIRIYLKNKQRTKQLSDDFDSENEDTQVAIKKIKDVYWDKRKKLQEEEYRATGELTERLEKLRNEKDTDINKLYEHICRVDRILAFLRLDLKRDITIGKIEIHHNIYFEDLGYFYNDDYLKIKAFILENNKKPKNKYSLILLGKTIFSEIMLEKLYIYGIFGINEHGTNLRYIVVDLPSVQEVKGYYDKNKGKIIKKYLDSYKEVKQDFLFVLNTYKFEDFKEINIEVEP